MRRSLCVVALLGLVTACQDAAVTAPPAGEAREITAYTAAVTDEGGPVTYFAPRTIVRDGTGVQTVQLPLQDRDHSLFMEPFVLHVQATGDQRIVGIVKVDGVPVLERRDMVALGGASEPLTLEVPVTPSSIITVELTGPPGGTFSLWIDAPLQPAPVITITSPMRHAGADVANGEPGAFLQQGTLLPSPVDITGTACHVRYPITDLEIAGVTVPVSGTNLCEPFTVTQQSRWGLSIINGTARNARGRVGTVVQSYARSPEYYALATGIPNADKVPGLFAQLNQSGLDDGDRTDVDDLATYLERTLSALTPAITPQTLISCTADLYQVNATGGAAFDAIQVHSISVTGSELAIDISMIRPKVDLLARWDFSPLDGDCAGNVADATIQASAVRFTARGAITVSAVGAVGVTLSDIHVATTGFTVTAPSVVEGLANLIHDLASSFIGDAVIQLLRPAVSSIITGFVQGFIAPLSRDVTLNSATVRVVTGAQSMLIGGTAPNGFLRPGTFAQTAPLTFDPSAQSQLGAIRSICTVLLPCTGGGAPVPPAFSATQYSFGLGVHQDVLNTLFWSSWRAGAFNVIDVSALPGLGSGTLQALSMSASATLPPVSMATATGDPMFEMGWGDVRVKSTYDPSAVGAGAGAALEVESWVSGVVRGTLTLDEAAGRFVLTGLVTDVEVQLTGPPLPFADAALRAAIASDVRATITQLARSAVAALPLDLTVDGLGVAKGVAVSREGAFYLLGGSIQ